MTDSAARDPRVNDPVLVRGRITQINAGTATVAVYRSDPVGLTMPVQCGALELDESPAAGGVSEGWKSRAQIVGEVMDGLGRDATAAEIACDLDFPVIPEQALAWAKQAQWFFRSYYKYAFVFEAYCTVAYPDDPEAHEVSALVEVCGETGDDIYRFQVQGPMTWDEISYPGTPELVIRDGDTELVRV